MVYELRVHLHYVLHRQCYRGPEVQQLTTVQQLAIQQRREMATMQQKHEVQL